MKKILSKLKPINILMLTLAGMINAFGITIFLTPVKLYDSGISGTSMLAAQLTPASLSLSVFPVILIAIRLKIQTKSSHKIHRSELLRLDFVNLNSWIAIMCRCSCTGRKSSAAFSQCMRCTRC
ncbi:YitT family protein [Ruminococcus albus]|uniref:YitT family protein n=1 Tax=Ruminococcus albus TaxID=1264 RepID=UPI001FA726EF|nr:YitT family protein [Ruminococcus albus]